MSEIAWVIDRLASPTPVPLPQVGELQDAIARWWFKLKGQHMPAQAHRNLPGAIAFSHAPAGLGAAVAFLEAALPDADWQVCKGGGCTVLYGSTKDGSDVLDEGVQTAPTPALGVLISALRAIEASK